MFRKKGLSLAFVGSPKYATLSDVLQPIILTCTHRFFVGGPNVDSLTQDGLDVLVEVGSGTYIFESSYSPPAIQIRN